MSSLILNGKVIATGTFTETPTEFRGDAVYNKALFKGLELIEEEPPAAGDWAYFEGVFTDLGAQMEAQRVQAALSKVSQFDAELTKFLDAAAQARRYDNRITCSLRAGYPGPFQAEGLAFAAWMDQCNATAYSLIGEVVAGTRPLPDSFEDVIPLLPVLVWPA